MDPCCTLRVVPYRAAQRLVFVVLVKCSSKILPYRRYFLWSGVDIRLRGKHSPVVFTPSEGIVVGFPQHIAYILQYHYVGIGKGIAEIFASLRVRKALHQVAYFVERSTRVMLRQPAGTELF